MELIGQEKKMTVKEVADVLGYEKDYLRKKVKELFPESVQNGIETTLNEHQVFKLKQYLVPRTLDMKVQGENAVTEIEKQQTIMLAMQYLQDGYNAMKARAIEAESKLEIAAPKAEFYDQVAESKDAIDMRTAAAVLNIKGLGRNKLFDKLRTLEILDGDNRPYRKYQDAGYFRVIETKFVDSFGDAHINIKTLVYQRGLDFIRKAVTK
jgi:phage antirepressor YoqD-like protein